MPVIEGQRAWDAMSIVEAQQTCPVDVVKGERIFYPVWPHRGGRDFGDEESDAPSVHQPISPTIIVQKATHRFIAHTEIYHP
jgi:hypothetical protein